MGNACTAHSEQDEDLQATQSLKKTGLSTNTRLFLHLSEFHLTILNGKLILCGYPGDSGYSY